jgi:UDP-3-O-[3-hydroxymyristoyl] glucosamine N-acyltransferase LpxD
MPGLLQDYSPHFLSVEKDARFDTLAFDLRCLRPRTLTFAGGLGFLMKALEAPEVSAIVTTSSLLRAAAERKTIPAEKGIALSNSPRSTFFLLHNALCLIPGFYARRSGFERGENTAIHERATISADGVHIGANVRIESNVVIKANVRVGDHCVIRAGSIIGGKGFQYLRGNDGPPISIAHSGGVSIGNRVEIHGSCAIDRHIFDDDTTIGDDTKFDNHVQFAHGSQIGRRCLVAAAAVIAGSVRIGDDVWIGPNSTVSDSLTIGDKAAISLGSVVVRDVPSGERVTGNFAEPHLQFLKRHLPPPQPRTDP